MTIDDIIRKTLQEDLGKGDITSNATVPESQEGVARIISKQPGVIAGTKIAWQVFKEMDSDLTIKLDFSDGDKVDENDTIIIAEGKIRSILQAERVALNFLAHLSGVATITAEFVDLVFDTNTKITDTRKTDRISMSCY